MRKAKEASISQYRLKTDEAQVITAITYQKRDKLRASVFIAGEFAFGVRALTQRIRDIVGTSGVILETGIVRYCGQYVCDGLVSGVVHLGRNYLRSFASAYERIRAQGRFEVEH